LSFSARMLLSSNKTLSRSEKCELGHLLIHGQIEGSVFKGEKVKADIALHGNPVSELWDVTCHMGSHSVTCHPTQVNVPRLTPAMQAGTRFSYPGGMEG